MTDDWKKAIDQYHEALRLDQLNRLPEALTMYKNALISLRGNLKGDKQNKQSINKLMEQILVRAETIKTHLREKYPDMSSTINAPPKVENNERPEPRAPHIVHDEPSDRERFENMEGLVLEKPKIKWSDVAGLEKAKAALQEAAILPYKYPVLFNDVRRPWRGILLYGPPGTGKTYLAQACAAEADAVFISATSADLMSKWQGESEKHVKDLFAYARKEHRSIIFIDEIDALCSTRGENDSESSRKVKTEFLVQMDGIQKESGGCLVIGATNFPWDLDIAMRRRFERRIYIPLPDNLARQQIVQLALNKVSHTLQPDDSKIIANETDGFSGSDITTLVRDALFQPLRRCQAATYFKRIAVNGRQYYTPCSPDDPDPTKEQRGLTSFQNDDLHPPNLTMDDFNEVLKSASCTVAPADVKRHEDWTMLYGQKDGA